MKSMVDATLDWWNGGDRSHDGPFFDPSTLTDSFWGEVFLRCDSNTLSAVSKTCKYFNKLLKDSHFWVEKCLFDNVDLPPIAWRRLVLEEEDRSFNFRRIHKKRPYGRNLVDYKMTRNMTMDQLKHTPNMNLDGDRGMIIQFDGQEGDGPILVTEGPLGPVEACIATSYSWGSKLYSIDLVKAGIDPWILDEIRPIITVRELAMCRHDCAAIYEFHAQLLKENELFDINTILPRFKTVTKSWEQWSGGVEWEVFEHVFENYPSGMRKTTMLSRGKDLQFWAGNYGSKFTNMEVVVTFPEEVRLKTLEEFPEPEKQIRAHPDVRRGLRIDHNHMFVPPYLNFHANDHLD